MGKIKLLLIAIVIVYISKRAIDIFGDKEFQEIPDYYWGPKDLQSAQEETTIYPFEITVEDRLLQDLKSKLKEELNSARHTPPLEGTAFDYGFNSNYLKNVTEYWLNKYNWRAREKLLNKYPHFFTKISGLMIHFQRVKSKNNSNYKKTLPLLLLHGWPGSIIEYQKIIPLLTDPKDSDINFELVIPSLPGYGLSDGAARPGLGPMEIGQIFKNLMIRLGHEKFYVEGGDWGGLIVTNMATAYPDNVIGMHTFTCVSFHPRAHLRLLAASLFPSFFMTAEESERFLPFSNFFTFVLRETGYLHIQASKPDTVGVGLLYSPSGLAAYILEKFSTWTNADYIKLEDGGITKGFTLNEVLDNVMLYWINNSITTSMRLYAEYFSKFPSYLESVPVKVPAGCVVPRFESYLGQTQSMVQDKYQNLLSYTYAQGGGHFYALEHPKELADDLISFIRKVEDLNSKNKP